MLRSEAEAETKWGGFNASWNAPVATAPSDKHEVTKAMKLIWGVRQIIQDNEHKKYTWEEWEEIITLLGLNQDRGCEDGDVSNCMWLGDGGRCLLVGSRRGFGNRWIKSWRRY